MTLALAIAANVLALVAIGLYLRRNFEVRCMCDKKDAEINDKLVNAAETQAGEE